MSNLPDGVYDRIVTSALRQALAELDATRTVTRADLKPVDAIDYLARELALRARKKLKDTEEADVLAEANALLEAAHADDPAELELLTGIATTGNPPAPPRIPMSASALVTNEHDINYNEVLRSELRSADRVDLICPFIGYQGINLIRSELARLGSGLRVITTTYLGATHLRALDLLAGMGAHIKIAYESPDQKTALHAKAWIFHRESGFTTATIGSSNLSKNALVDGLEWNVRVGSADASQLLEELRVTFERLWARPTFEPYDPTRDRERVRRALKCQIASDDSGPSFYVDVEPRAHQIEALEALRFARLEGQHKNLIVAATGTGKTLLSAFDYQRLASENKRRPNLLYVAHRGDILKQSREAFRSVLRDQSFGELHVGDHRADAWGHVFASIQSLHGDAVNRIPHEHFEVLIVDEFHHAEAPTYRKLLEHLRPGELLALTATPERADGKSVVDRFGAPTFELRLWHALDRQLLSPFHYFGIDDQTDLTKLQWVSGRYRDAELETLYVRRGEARTRIVLRELQDKAPEGDDLRCVAFCVSIAHADFMAAEFREAGYQAEALHSRAHERDATLKQFRDGQLQIICTVDLLNEGVDVPEINTVLFLRPTESATVFVQQLGRGLRKHRDKGALVVLDFVGQQNQKFRMDLRFRAMTGQTRTELESSVKSGFLRLPAGCDIQLQREVAERVLRNLKEAIPTRLDALVDEVRRLALNGDKPKLSLFLRETGLEPSDLYRSNRSFSQVLSVAKLLKGDLPSRHHRVGALIHVDDKLRAKQYAAALQGEESQPGFDRMLAFPLLEALSLAEIPEAIRAEALELLEALRPESRSRLADDLPFSLHASYSRDEIVAPFRDNPASMRQGTFYVEDLELDIHLVTLNKSERDFSPTTRYQDYFEGPEVLHWESQSTTLRDTPTGRRLVEGLGRHLFFVRESKNSDGRTAPFFCAGFASPIWSEGEKPIRMRWKLEHAVPDHRAIKLVAAAG